MSHPHPPPHDGGRPPTEATQVRRPQGWPPQQPAPWTGPPGPPPPPGFGQPPPPQGWPGPPPNWAPQGPAQLPGAGLGTHLRRAVDWNVAQVTVAPRERQALEAAGVHDRLQGLFAWRRSSLLVALPVLLLSVVLSIAGAADTDTDNLSEFGVLILWLPSIALMIVPLGCVRVLTRWTELRSTSRFLLACWLTSIVIPLLAALVPIDLLIDDLDALRAQAAQNGTSAQVDQALQAGRLSLAVGYALVLLPVVLSVPGGMLKGAARVKSLFPSSGLPGWFLVALAPFYSMFVVVVFVLIGQLAGNGLLLLGVGLIAFSPWLFVIYRNVYSRPLSLAEAKGELARASRFGGLVMGAGIFFVVIFLFTGTVGNLDVLGDGDGDSVFSYLDVSRSTVEVLARSIVTAVVFSTVFLGMIFAEWRTTQGTREDIRVEHQREMMSLERYVSDRGRRPDAQFGAGAPAAPPMPPPRR